MVNFLKIFEKFFCTGCAGCSNCVSVFAPNGRQFFSAPALWGTRTASAGSPCPGGSFFSAPAERETRTAAGVFVPDGREVFAEPQQGDSPSADGGSVAAPAAGTMPYPRRWAKRKDNLRFSFLFELLPFPY